MGAPALPLAAGRSSPRGQCGRRGCATVAQAPPGGEPKGKLVGSGVIRFFSKGEASAAEPAPAAGAQAMGDVLRAIRLLEQRETELRDEMKNILGLMAASAEALQAGATSSSSPLALAAARLERCVAGCAAQPRAGRPRAPVLTPRGPQGVLGKPRGGCHRGGKRSIGRWSD